MSHVNIVAECCCNHMGDLSIAKEMIRTAKECGADIVKFQKRDLDSMPADLRDKPYEGPHSFGKTYGAHRFVLEFSNEQWIELRNFAYDTDIGLFATPFDIPSAEFLTWDLHCVYIKMGSTQIHDEKMIEWFSKCKQAKIIMSSGMINEMMLKELFEKVDPWVMMQTTSSYPCNEQDVNLASLQWFRKLPCEIGLSGHYVSGNGAIEAAAVALGATWIERHFTLDRTWKGSDQAASLEPEGLRNVVKAVRTVERALGDGVKKFEECERPTWEKIKK